MDSAFDRAHSEPAWLTPLVPIVGWIIACGIAIVVAWHLGTPWYGLAAIAGSMGLLLRDLWKAQAWGLLSQMTMLIIILVTTLTVSWR